MIIRGMLLGFIKINDKFYTMERIGTNGKAKKHTHIYTNTSPRCGDVFDVMNLFGREEKKSLKLDAFRRVKTPLLTRTHTHTVCR